MKRREILPYTVSPEQIRTFSRLPVASRLRFLEEMARLLLEARLVEEEPGREGQMGQEGSDPGLTGGSRSPA